MRMITGRLKPQEEHGVAAAIVVVSLFVLLGMLVLSIDIGSLLLKHRVMVNSNDSAALAAAISFAKEESSLADPSVGRNQADSFATQNIGDAVRYPAPAGDPDGPAPEGFKAVGGIAGSSCDPAKCGTVTVWYLGHMSLFFAQIFGHGRNAILHEKAQAIWGPAGGATPQPIMVRFDWMQTQCKVPVPNDNPPTECDFWLDNAAVGDAQWSFVNLISDKTDPNWGWDVPKNKANPGCTNVSSNIVDGWINGSYPVGNLALNYPAPTYACKVVGKSANHYQDLKNLETKFRYFPVNDPDGQVDKNGDLCTPPMEQAGQCNVDKYDIIGFNVLRIDHVYKGNEENAVGAQNVLCSPAINRDFTAVPGPNHTFDLTTQVQCPLLNLHFPGNDRTKLYPRIREATGNKEYSYGQAPGPGVDYTYDPVTHVITWVSQDPLNQIVLNTRVDWDYDTAGACGARGSDPNAICLVSSWQGYQSGGLNPGGGADFGLRAVRLSA